MIAPRFVDITVERTTKYITVEEIDKRTGEVQTRRLRFTGVTITIKAPGVELSFTSTRTRSGWGMWRDARTVETARVLHTIPGMTWLALSYVSLMRSVQQQLSREQSN